MLLSEEQKAVIRATWKITKERGGDNTALGRAIFLRLFEVAPEMQQLFPFKDEPKEELPNSKKLARHGANFVRHLEKAIESMDKLFGEVGPRLVALGVRHYGYGAEEAHFAVIAPVLLHVMQNVLGSDYTPQVEEAFTTLSNIVTEAMLEGTKDH